MLGGGWFFLTLVHCKVDLESCLLPQEPARLRSPAPEAFLAGPPLTKLRRASTEGRAFLVSAPLLQGIPFLERSQADHVLPLLRKGMQVIFTGQGLPDAVMLRWFSCCFSSFA